MGFETSVATTAMNISSKYLTLSRLVFDDHW